MTARSPAGHEAKTEKYALVRRLATGQPQGGGAEAQGLSSSCSVQLSGTHPSRRSTRSCC